MLNCSVTVSNTAMSSEFEKSIGSRTALVFMHNPPWKLRCFSVCTVMEAPEYNYKLENNSKTTKLHLGD